MQILVSLSNYSTISTNHILSVFVHLKKVSCVMEIWEICNRKINLTSIRNYLRNHYHYVCLHETKWPLKPLSRDFRQIKVSVPIYYSEIHNFIAWCWKNMKLSIFADHTAVTLRGNIFPFQLYNRILSSNLWINTLTEIVSQCTPT